MEIVDVPIRCLVGVELVHPLDYRVMLPQYFASRRQAEREGLLRILC